MNAVELKLCHYVILLKISTYMNMNRYMCVSVAIY